MIDEIRFSAAGETPTELEQRLLAESVACTAWVMLGQRLIAELGREQGARALALAMDELGTLKVHVPCRQSFFADLWREERDALVLSLSTRPDWGTRDIADTLGMTVQAVRRVRRRSTGRGERRPGDKRLPP